MLVLGLLAEEDVPPMPTARRHLRRWEPCLQRHLSPRHRRARLSPAEQDASDAEAAVVKYFQVLDRLSRNPKVRLNELTEVARGQAAAQQQENITDYRRRELRQTGKVVVVNPVATVTVPASTG